MDLVITALNAPRCRNCDVMLTAKNAPPSLRSSRQRQCRSCNRKTQQAGFKRYNAKLRAQTFAAYGGACVCCGEDNPGFLTLDHIGGKGVGKAHRESTSQSGSGHLLYRILRREGWPPYVRLMCWNCHMSTTHEGECPHESMRRTALRIVNG